jgi:hypothetical protein
MHEYRFLYWTSFSSVPPREATTRIEKGLMAHRTELNNLIARFTGVSKHTVDRIGVNLNKSGLLQSGGRGRYAPDMGPEDLKNIILALLGAESTGRVFETVLQLHGLVADDGRKFGEIILEICTNKEVAAEVMQISVLRNFPGATVYWKDESGTRIGRMQDFKNPAELQQPGMRVVASLSGTVFSRLVELIGGP